MNFISLTFIIFFFILLLLYQIVPSAIRWKVLLLGSFVFYLWAGWEKLLFVLVTAGIAFVVGKRIDWIYAGKKKQDELKKKKARGYLIIGIVLILLQLFYAKLGQDIAALFQANAGDAVKTIVPLGISYYTLSIIGYLCDVYWQKDKAESVYFRLLLYMIYFPAILQGPIHRHQNLSKQLYQGYPIEYGALCFGLQRMVWGFFKKMVIADRFAVITSEIFKLYHFYSGQYFVVAVLSSAIQLYCDFSGCMDIALGASECFGISLDENFRRPFFSRSSAEFWRRWHITLGAWFRDYVYMPMVASPLLAGIGRQIKKWFGARAGKNAMMAIPIAVVWLLTGLWHGTGLDYIIWGIYWGVIIIVASLFAAQLKKPLKLMHIDEKSEGWAIFERFRTFLIFCGGRLLTAPGDLKISLIALKSMFTEFNIWIWFDGSLNNLGLDRKNLCVGIIAVLILCVVEHKQEKGIEIRKRIADMPVFFRWSIYYGAIAAVLLFGMYGSGNVGNGFIYMKY